MANEEHLAKLKQGVDAWNAWRKGNPGIKPDLRGADLFGVDLQGADLYGVDFQEADLQGADLSEANLNEAHLEIALLNDALLNGAQLIWAHLNGAHLNRVDLNKADLQAADLIGADLIGAHLKGARLIAAYLHRANLRAADLEGANLTHAGLGNANLASAQLNEACLERAYLDMARLERANLERANLEGADLYGVDLYGACLKGANLRDATLREANLNDADLTGADLEGATIEKALLVEANLRGANLTRCKVYGISAWGVKFDDKTEQKGLIVTPYGEPTVTVDDLEIAQFIYLLLNRQKLRDVIDTITSKAVLILGRFTPERKSVLEAMADELRKRNLLPIIFDFERSTARDFTETIKVLAGLSLFVIVDLTNPKSAPLELQATVPDYQIPFVPIIQAGEEPFSMFGDLRKYGWVLDPVITYSSTAELIGAFDKAILERAFQKHKELLLLKAQDLSTKSASDYLSERTAP